MDILLSLCAHVYVCTCVCPSGGERAYEGGEGCGQIPPLQLSHQVHQHVGPQSGLFYWLVKDTDLMLFIKYLSFFEVKVYNV